MATSLMPSMPDAGSMTRAPRRSRSKVVLTDMLDLLSRSLARFSLPAKCEVYFVFSYTNIRAIDSIKFMQGCGVARARERFDGRETLAKNRTFLAARSTSRLPDTAAASNPRRLVPEELRCLRDYAAPV